MKWIRRTISSRLIKLPAAGMVKDRPEAASMKKVRPSTTLPLRQKPSLKMTSASLRTCPQASGGSSTNDVTERQRRPRMGGSSVGQAFQPDVSEGQAGKPNL